VGRRSAGGRLLLTATKVSASIAKKCIVERLGIMPLKVGDLVRLKIGGPAMTIEAVDGRSPVVICTWIAGEVRRGRFNASILQKVAEKQDKPERSDVLGVSDRSRNASGSDH
jgi:uncharacterized protein YodC (DUF2158 family)